MRIASLPGPVERNPPDQGEMLRFHRVLARAGENAAVFADEQLALAHDKGITPLAGLQGAVPVVDGQQGDLLLRLDPIPPRPHAGGAEQLDRASAGDGVRPAQQADHPPAAVDHPLPASAAPHQIVAGGTEQFLLIRGLEGEGAGHAVRLADRGCLQAVVLLSQGVQRHGRSLQYGSTFGGGPLFRRCT